MAGSGTVGESTGVTVPVDWPSPPASPGKSAKNWTLVGGEVGKLLMISCQSSPSSVESGTKVTLLAPKSEPPIKSKSFRGS